MSETNPVNRQADQFRVNLRHLNWIFMGGPEEWAKPVSLAEVEWSVAFNLSVVVSSLGTDST